MVFWVGFNSNLAVICPIFAHFWPKTGFLTGVVLEYTMGGGSIQEWGSNNVDMVCIVYLRTYS